MSLEVLFKDNHLLIVNKPCGLPVQSDNSGDKSLLDIAKEYIKTKYNKPGNVYLGLPHRLDRPTSGIVVLAKTSKALERLAKMFKTHEIQKIYWAVVDKMPPKHSDTLTHYIYRDTKKNKSFAYPNERKNTKLAKLNYKLIANSDNYFLLEIELLTGRHHQIRAQLAQIGCHIKGDLKYGSARSNKDGGIHLHARKVVFIHPVSKEQISIIAPTPQDPLWNVFKKF